VKTWKLYLYCLELCIGSKSNTERPIYIYRYVYPHFNQTFHVSLNPIITAYPENVLSPLVKHLSKMWIYKLNIGTSQKAEFRVSETDCQRNMRSRERGQTNAIKTLAEDKQTKVLKTSGATAKQSSNKLMK